MDNNGKHLGTVTFTNHFIKQARHKGFTADQIAMAIEQTDPNPRDRRVTQVTKYPGQLRYCGGGVAVIMDGNSAITIYADRVITPMREDQREDPEAQASRRLAVFSYGDVTM